jgi:predicted transcriptional regulator
VFVISSKNDQVIHCIQNLRPGTKVSVRKLAEELHLSAGTVYKAIKDAEAEGLVVTKPKAGTVRIDSESRIPGNTLSGIELMRGLGLHAEAGRQNLSNEIQKIIVCDSNVTSLQRRMGNYNTSSVLCICGQRPEMHRAILGLGANLLITDFQNLEAVDRISAERMGLFILSSAMDTYTFLRVFERHFGQQKAPAGGETVRSWMESPDYLYDDDIVADWLRLYSKLPVTRQLPIVDSELQPIGGVDILQAAAAEPSIKLSRLISRDEMYLCLDADELIGDAAQEMMLKGVSLGVVQDHGKMIGTLSGSDLLRYYMYTASKENPLSIAPFLRLDDELSTENRFVYALLFPDETLENVRHVEVYAILTAISELMKSLGCIHYTFTNCTFYSEHKIVFTDGLILTCLNTASDGNYFIIEAEINDEQQSYIKGIFTISRDMTKED